MKVFLQRCILLLVISFTILGCKKSYKDEFTTTLLEKKWVYVPTVHLTNNVRLVYYVKFYDDGTARNFHIASDTESIEVDADVDPDAYSWKYDSNSKLLSIYGRDFKILSSDKNKIILLSKSDSSKVMLYNIDGKENKIENGIIVE